jgi:hypothetical protein
VPVLTVPDFFTVTGLLAGLLLAFFAVALPPSWGSLNAIVLG